LLSYFGFYQCYFIANLIIYILQAVIKNNLLDTIKLHDKGVKIFFRDKIGTLPLCIISLFSVNRKAKKIFEKIETIPSRFSLVMYSLCIYYKPSWTAIAHLFDVDMTYEY